jgi:hypothetical protein
VVAREDDGLRPKLLRHGHGCAFGDLASPDSADLEAVANRLERTVAEADPRQAKALLRLVIKELRDNGRSEILPTYRIITPEVCALPSSVGGTGLEPVIPSLSSWYTARAGRGRSNSIARSYAGLRTGPGPEPT